jgi:uncharacterized protein (TIGR03118 family)
MSNSLVRRAVLVTAYGVLLSSFAAAQQYHRTDLTTDSSAVSATAANVDPNLLNPWGLARSTGSPWWVSDNGTGLSTLYNATGVPQSLIVKIPTPNGTGTAAPSGNVFNATSGFLLAPGAKAFFLFVTEDGTIAGWNPTVNPNAVLLKNRAGKAFYKGCAIVQTADGPRFYATNFLSGQVEVFAQNMNRIGLGDPNAFRFPGLSSSWSPFNIQNVGGNLVVTFAHRKPGSLDEDHGAGLGRAAVFSPTGHLLLTLQGGPWFNAPWGVALAPGDFGQFSHRLLIGNFGDGTIQAFDVFTGHHEGAMLEDTTGKTLAIDGLWALSFGGDTANDGNATTLFFSSGPNSEADGIFGQLTAISAEQAGNSQ